ncbi:MAG: SDR family NAD(P)-dependent oxidoreductase [Oscillospiraceae bacterium]|nr:SDR family NAD(P)-dependent oxidoreductase [Oscillospiraceae bacterium]
MITKKTAVVTGASSGMGRIFARKLDATKKYDEIWLIARNREKLEKTADELSSKVRIIQADLTKEEGIKKYKEMLISQSPSVTALVNAAGFGFFGDSLKMDPDKLALMVELNCKALMNMTYATLPYMKAGAEIYQFASRAAFQPVPFISVYSATKAFVLSFSRSLNVELASRKIKVMALCPAWVQTEFFDTAVLDKSISYYDKIYDPEKIVSKAMKDMSRSRDISIYGFTNLSTIVISKILPHRLFMKMWCGQQKIDPGKERP